MLFSIPSTWSFYRSACAGMILRLFSLSCLIDAGSNLTKWTNMRDGIGTRGRVGIFSRRPYFLLRLTSATTSTRNSTLSTIPNQGHGLCDTGSLCLEKTSRIACKARILKIICVRVDASSTSPHPHLVLPELNSKRRPKANPDTISGDILKCLRYLSLERV